MVAAHFVRVRRAELALHLPDEIGQLAARGDPVEQRRIAVVDAHSSRCPTCPASRSGRAAAARLRAASAAIRLRGSTDDAHASPGRSSRSCATARPTASAVIGGSSLRLAGSARSRLPSRIDERRAVVGQHEAIDFLEQRLRAQRFEVEELEASRRFLVAAAAVRADDRQQRPDHLVAGDARDLAEASLRHGKRRHAPRDAGRGRRASARSACPRRASRRRRDRPASVPSAPDRTAAAHRPAARSGTAARRAGSDSSNCTRRTPDRTCGSTGNRGTCRADRTRARSR